MGVKEIGGFVQQSKTVHREMNKHRKRQDAISLVDDVKDFCNDLLADFGMFMDEQTSMLEASTNEQALLEIPFCRRGPAVTEEEDDSQEEVNRFKNERAHVLEVE